MKEDIKKWKEHNGNNTFTQKEMLIYLITKADKLDSRMDDLDPRISKIEGWFSALKIFIPSVIAVIGWLAIQHIL